MSSSHQTKALKRHAADFMFLLLVQTTRCARHSHMERPAKPRLQP